MCRVENVCVSMFLFLQCFMQATRHQRERGANVLRNRRVERERAKEYEKIDGRGRRGKGKGDRKEGYGGR